MVGFILMKVSSCSSSVRVPNTMTTMAVTMAIIGTWRVTTKDATIAITTATMNAPVASNKLALALAKKKISSGPRSVASLNSGCGCFLSMSAFNPCNRFRKIPRGEGCEIVDALADADEVHREFVLLGQRNQDAAARGAVEFCHHQPRDARCTMKRLDLRQRVLSHRGIEHQQHRVRRRCIDLLDDAHDLFKLVHQFGLVLQPPCGI